MTEREAFKLMEKGELITHDYFDSNEYMTLENGDILFEDGSSCTIDEFWTYREKDAWEDGYSVFEIKYP